MHNRLFSKAAVRTTRTKSWRCLLVLGGFQRTTFYHCFLQYTLFTHKKHIQGGEGGVNFETRGDDVDCNQKRNENSEAGEEEVHLY